MDEKGRSLLKHVEQILQETLSTRKGKQAQAERQERILQSLHALLTACEAKLFSKECVKEFLEGVARVLSETTLSSKNPDLVRKCLNKAIKLARGSFSPDLEKRLKALLPEGLGIS
jgi:N-glycosylase/DNA lyase